MFIESDKNPGFEAFKANDENPETCWQAGATKDQWLEVEWIEPQTFSKVVIDEVGSHISSYKVQHWDGNMWQDLATGDACGMGKEHVFDAVASTKCRLLIVDAANAALITEFKIGQTK
jgi:alpha-L-rhamnosidase